MRAAFDSAPTLDVLPIDKIQIPTDSRDELPPVLRALQWIWTHPTLRTQIMALLSAKIVASKKATGRTGMDLWQILVLGTVRLTLGTDWDRIQHLANYDVLLRAMLGVSGSCFSGDTRFHRRTLRDNVSLLEASLLEQINALVAAEGKKVFASRTPMEVRVDSYVVECDVHFPTDFNLLWDSARKSLDCLGKFFQKGFNLPGWRKIQDWRGRTKAAERASAKASSGGGKNKSDRIKALTEEYLEVAQELAAKLEETRPLIQAQCTTPQDLVLAVQLDYYRQMLDKHRDLLKRRVILGETIPTAEKIYSIFEPHTEWINKGKAHQPVELGHRLLVATDQNQLILAYKTPARPDSQESIEIMDQVLGRFGSDSVASVSFDKGFTDQADKELIQLYVRQVIMPKRGKKTEAQVEEESAPKYVKARRAHSAIESAINALEHHGLDRCLDVGLSGFERYVGYGILAYNLHIVGRELERQERLKELAEAA